MRTLTNSIVIASPAGRDVAIHLSSSWIASSFAKATEDRSSPAGRGLLAMTNGVEA